eukprot:COSAG04_NODE_2023_length_4980_cov_7.536980_2_plen_178_part_00
MVTSILVCTVCVFGECSHCHNRRATTTFTFTAAYFVRTLHTGSAGPLPHWGRRRRPFSSREASSTQTLCGCRWMAAAWMFESASTPAASPLAALAAISCRSGASTTAVRGAATPFASSSVPHKKAAAQLCMASRGSSAKALRRALRRPSKRGSRPLGQISSAPTSRTPGPGRLSTTS